MCEVQTHILCLVTPAMPKSSYHHFQTRATACILKTIGSLKDQRKPRENSSCTQVQTAFSLPGHTCTQREWGNDLQWQANVSVANKIYMVNLVVQALRAC